jgi:CRP/FNR family transcriptional regulator, cyclic AMP receptor protein
MVKVEALRSCELFTGLSDEALEQIAALAVEEAYQAGQEIFAEQQPADRLFILLCGRVQVHIHLGSSLRPDRELTVDEVEPGRIIGWSSLVRQQRFTASARALEPVTAIVVDAADLNALFDRNAHIGFVVMKQLANVVASRLSHTRQRLEQQEQNAG